MDKISNNFNKNKYFSTLSVLSSELKRLLVEDFSNVFCTELEIPISLLLSNQY